MVESKTNNVKTNSLLKLLTRSLVLAVISVGSYFYFVKFDLTADQRYTLSSQTIDLLNQLEEVVTVKVYLEGKALPADFVKLKNGVEEQLNEFSSYSGSLIEYEFIDLLQIKSRTKREREIQRIVELGIPYLPVQQKKESGTNSFYVIPGAEIFYKGKSIGVNLLKTDHVAHQDNFKASLENLEYQLSTALRKLTRERTKNVGFLQLHGESDQYQLEDLAKTLSEYYNIGPVILQNEQGLFDLNALNFIDLLVIAGPRLKFNEYELFIIDQYVMRGGKLLVLLDGIYAELDSLRNSPFFPAMPYKSGLEKLLFKYGVRVNNDIVEDQQCAAIPINTGPAGSSSKPKLHPWVYFPLIFTDNKHLITRNLEPIKLEFASTLDPVAVSSVKCTSLLNTSDNSKYRNTPTSLGFEAALKSASGNELNDKAKSVSLLAEGRFSSFFSNRILPDGVAEKKAFIQNSDSSALIVVGSGSIGNNIVLPDDKTLPLGADRYSNIFYDNKKFLLNCINYLTGDAELIPVRSKKVLMRLLDKQKLKAHEDQIKWLNVIIPPFIILLIAIGIVSFRKYRFTR